MSVINCSVQEPPFEKTYEIWKKYECNPDMVIIFPNRRSCRYFRQWIQKRSNTINFPTIYSVTDLFFCDINVVEIINILASKEKTLPLRTVCDLADEIANTIQEIVFNQVDYRVLCEKIPYSLQPYWKKIDDILQSVDSIIGRLIENLNVQIVRANSIISTHKTIAVELGRANNCVANFLEKIIKNPDNTVLLLSLDAQINHKIKSPLLKKEFPCNQSSHIVQNHIEYAEFKTINEEISGVAFATRQALSQNKSVLIVTQSQDFTCRLKIELMRWNIIPDTSLGTSLIETQEGKLLVLVAEVLKNNFDCNSMINLLKQRKDLIDAVYEFEIYRRNFSIAPRSFIACYSRYKNKDPNLQNILDDVLNAVSNEDLSQRRSFKAWIEISYSVLGAIFNDLENMLQHTDFYLLLSSDLLMSIDEFVTFLNSKILTESEQQAEGYTPNIAIVGIIEAQLLSADLIIIANANTSNFTTYDNNVILTKSMRKIFGIQNSEQQNDFIASIFERLMNQSNVLVTRSVYVEENLQTEYPLLRKFYMFPSELPETMFSMIQNIPYIEKAKRVSPIPNVLPQKISASSVDLLVNNPYVFYVKNILKLQEIPPLISCSVKGNFIHEILYRFIHDKLFSTEALWKEVKKIMYENKLQISDIGSSYFQLSTLFDFLLKNFDRRKQYYPEINGKFYLQLTESEGIILQCRADCLEVDEQGHCAIIDYKTYESPSAHDVEALKKMQLPFEAIIAIHGGFGIKITDVNSLQYWQINNEMKIKEVLSSGKISAVCDRTEKLIKEMLYKTRSYQLNLSDKDKYNACYKHLARYQEWIND